MKYIYLDNAATSFPKPSGVNEGMLEFMNNVGANINRSAYGAALEAGLTALSLREKFCKIFNHPDPTHVIITSGATASLNMVIKGYLKPGDHCIVSSMEHNAVMRPLMQMTEQGISFDRIPCDKTGRLNPNDIIPLIKPNTKLLIMAHASNVCGTVQDAEAVGIICKEYNISFLLDASQTAGHYPVDFTKFNLSALAAPGHKGLLGPSGIGVLLLETEFAKKITPLITGGTGSASDSELQPVYMPDRFESGTMNLPGIFGLEKALSFIEDNGIENLAKAEIKLTKRFLDGIKNINGIHLVGTTELESRVGVISVDFTNIDNANAAFRLEQEYGILTRCGLHCAPNAHKTLGTFPKGTVRFSIGYSTTIEEIDTTIKAIKTISEA